ncbi:MAG: hypothetical protein NTW37_16170 [Proteobacteria bacterium]|nr:hypothetical protein [Pseudomonadota bacterium]
MPAASAGRLPLAATARTVAAVGASLLTLAILLGGRLHHLRPDLGVGVMLRGMTAWQVIAGRDLVAGLAYYAAITAFALAPSILARARTATASGRG